MRGRNALRLTLLLAAGVALTAALLPGAGSARSNAPPKNIKEPTILGTAIEGNTLTASGGTWSGSTPLTFKLRWLRCPKTGSKPDGSNCGVIPGETQSAYQVRSADIGFRIRVHVSATNSEGSASAASNPTAVVKAAGKKPASTSPPTISGSPVVGQTLTANPGNWSGSQPISFGYLWQRCDKDGGSCSTIGGANDKTYTLKSVDAGNTLRIQVRASNSAGTTFATSVPTAVIRSGIQPPPPPPPASGCPAGSGPIQVTDLASPARLRIDGQQSNPSVVGRGTQRLVLRYHVSACGGRSVQGALVYVTALPFNQFTTSEQTTGQDGWAELNLRRLSAFPVSPQQGLLALFVRARKSGDNLLGGISSRRLFTVRVSL